MKKMVLISIALLAGYMPLAFASGAQSLLFDFNGALLPSGGGWNIVDNHLTGVHITSATDSQGVNTSVSLNISNAFHFKGSGGSEPSPSLGYDANACKDSFYLLSSGSNTAQIKFGGLTPGEMYEFIFFGSRATTGTRIMNVTISGVTVSYDAVNNTSTTAVLSGVVAPQSGVVDVNFAVASGSTYAHLGLIEIKGAFGMPEADEEGIYVAPWGLDTNPGTKMFPLATFLAARDKVRQVKSGGLPAGGLSVYFRGGVYNMTAGIGLYASDSGEQGASVVYRPYKNEQVIFSGGASLDPAWFEPVEATQLLRLNLPQRGITNYGFKELHINAKRMTLVDQLADVNAAGKYSLDTATGDLCLYPPAPFEGSEDIRFAMLETNMFTLYNVSYVTLKGFVLDTGRVNAIKCDAYFADTGTANLQNYVRLEGLTIRNFRQAAVSLRGTGNVVEGCHIYNMGGKAVNMFGGDLITLTPGNGLVKNNRIHDVSNVSTGPGWGTAVDFAGVGQIMRNNLIYDTAPGLAATTIRGNDHLIEYNEFTGIFNGQSDDCGVIYFNMSAVPHYRGTVIRNNFFHNVGEAAGRQCAVYVDWCTQDVVIEGNIFYRMSGPDQNSNWKAGIMSNSSNYVDVTNNMFIDCSIPYRVSYWLSTWGTQQQLDFLLTKRSEVFSQFDFTQMAHSVKYPELLDLEFRDPVDAWIYPRENTFERNLIYNPAVNIRSQWYCPVEGYKLVSDSDISPSGPSPDTLWAGRQNNNWAATTDPGFVDFAGADFRLADNAPIFNMIQGFEPIPVEKIGLIKHGDLNEDGFVNLLDFAVMAGMWLQVDEGSGLLADIDGDGMVDTGDLAILMSEWLN